MGSPVVEVYSPVLVSATGNIRAVPCQLGGVFVSSASASPSITIYDSATTTTTSKIVDTFTPLAGTYYPLPYSLQSGCYVVIAGTVSCTIGVA